MKHETPVGDIPIPPLWFSTVILILVGAASIWLVALTVEVAGYLIWEAFS